MNLNQRVSTRIEVYGKLPNSTKFALQRVANVKGKSTKDIKYVDKLYEHTIDNVEAVSWLCHLNCPTPTYNRIRNSFVKGCCKWPQSAQTRGLKNLKLKIPRFFAIVNLETSSVLEEFLLGTSSVSEFSSLRFVGASAIVGLGTGSVLEKNPLGRASVLEFSKSNSVRPVNS